MPNTKISALNTLAQADIDSSADLLPIVDNSATETKKATPAALIGAAIDDATAKTTPVDADTVPLTDSAASNVLKKLSWANIKATLKTYFDTLYQAAGAYITASSTDTLTNKTFNANGTGNSITNLEVADFAAGVVDTDLSSVSASDDTIPSAKATKAALDGKASSTFVDAVAGVIETPADGDYRIVVNMPYAGTINSTTTRSASGTCTATFKVNTTALGGTANSVSSSEQEQSHSSSNTFVAGDDIVITVSANSSCSKMSFLIKVTRSI